MGKVHCTAPLVTLAILIVGCGAGVEPDRPGPLTSSVPLDGAPSSVADAGPSPSGDGHLDAHALDGHALDGARELDAAREPDAAARKPDAAGTTSAMVSTLAGGPAPGMADGIQGAARFQNPVNVEIAAGGELLVADYDNAAVRRISGGGLVTTLCQLPEGISVFGLAAAGKLLYVQADWNALGEDETGSLWSLDLASGASALLLDEAGQNRGLALLPDGRLAMSDYVSHVLRIYDPATGALSTLAGTAGLPGSVDGTGAAARFDSPGALDLSVQGELIVADTMNHRLRLVGLDGTVTTLTGTGVAASVDGSLATASFNAPSGLAVDDAGAIFVTDMGGFVVRRVAAGQVETVAGDGTPGYADGPALQARFYGLEGIAVSGDGKQVYIADGNRGEETPPYNRVRLLSR